jgi:glycosyltransferase involved in cell wall biosynthesis
MKILHTEASEGWGGQEIRILDESAGLIARGHEVHIAAPAASPILSAAQKRAIPVHPMPINRRSFGALRKLIALVSELRPDVIITHSSTDSWLVLLCTRLMRGRPAVVRTRHLGFQVGRGALNRWLYAHAPDRVVTTGEATRQMLIQSLHIDPARVVSIPTGIDTKKFAPGDKGHARKITGLEHGGEPVIGIVATLRFGKAHRFLIPVLADARLGSARLVIVGDGPQEPALRAQVAELGLASRVVFAGRQDDVVPWLNALDVFALPSTAIEGAPQALMQAMACGIPVVTTPVGAIPEMVRDGENGLFVTSGETQSIADAIARLAEDKGMAKRLAMAGRRHAEARFAIAAMLDSMEKLLADAVASRGEAKS